MRRKTFLKEYETCGARCLCGLGGALACACAALACAALVVLTMPRGLPLEVDRITVDGLASPEKARRACKSAERPLLAPRNRVHLADLALEYAVQ